MQEWELQPARDLALKPGEKLKSLERENGLMFTTMHLAWWSVVRSYLAVWHRLSISGLEHLPLKPPFILIANHASHLDTPAMATVLPWRQRSQIFPIAAGDVFFKTPVSTAFAAGLLNALPMWRKKCGAHAMDQLRKRLIEQPCSYIIFPEGTRSRDGTMAAFKPGLGMLVAGTNVPVVPCYLDGCHAALPATSRLPRPRKIRIRIGAAHSFADVANDRDGWRTIASTMEERVKQLATNPQ